MRRIGKKNYKRENKRHKLFCAFCFLVCGFCLLFPSRNFAQTKRATVLDGVYTDAQATRGRAAYERSCANCHAADLSGFSGPPLKTNLFMDRWREFNLNVLFDLIKDTMPRDAPGSLTEKDYLDIVSHILRTNGISAGSKELTANVLSTTLLVGKDGPKALPNSAQVRVVGCMTESSGIGWFLTKASEPARTLNMWEVTDADLQAAKSEPLGNLAFRLENLSDLPSFNPANFIDQKMEAKGILVRQPGNERINVASLKAVISTCDR